MFARQDVLQFWSGLRIFKIPKREIGTLIKRKSKGQLYPTRLIRSNNTTDIPNHFVNVGPNLPNSIEPSNGNPISYIFVIPQYQAF